MALTIGQLASITQDHIIPQAVDNIFLANPLMFRFREKGIKKTGGKFIDQPLLYAATTAAGSYKGYDLLDTSPNDQLTDAQFEWRQYFTNVTISGEEELKNSGKEAILNLLELKRMAAERTLEDLIGTGIQGSNNTTGKDIDGLGLVLNVNGSYAGIATADMSKWNPQGPALATANTLAQLDFQHLIGSCTIGADKPTVLATRQSVFDKTWSLWTGQQRFEDGAMADAGFQSMRINGIPLVVDPHIAGTDYTHTDNWLEALNERYLFLFTHKDVDWKVVPIPPQRDQDVKMVRILWAGNLACSSRRMQGSFQTINPSL